MIDFNNKIQGMYFGYQQWSQPFTKQGPLLWIMMILGGNIHNANEVGFNLDHGTVDFIPMTKRFTV